MQPYRKRTEVDCSSMKEESTAKMHLRSNFQDFFAKTQQSQSTCILLVRRRWAGAKKQLHISDQKYIRRTKYLRCCNNFRSEEYGLRTEICAIVESKKIKTTLIILGNTCVMVDLWHETVELLRYCSSQVVPLFRRREVVKHLRARVTVEFTTSQHNNDFLKAPSLSRYASDTKR